MIDDYAEDWRSLAYLQLRVQANVLPVGTAEHARAVGLLRVKYPQYAAMAIDQLPVLRITPEAIVA